MKDYLTYARNSPRWHGEQAAHQPPPKRGRPTASELEAKLATAPRVPRVLTTEQSQLVDSWHDVRDTMNEAAEMGMFALADEYLARLRSIESTLGFVPIAKEG